MHATPLIPPKPDVMNRSATKPEDQICYHGKAPIGTVLALEAILDHAAKQQKPIEPVKFPVDIFVTEVIRNDKPLKVQIEVDDYVPPTRDVYDTSFGCTGEGPFETEEQEAEVYFGKCYTADSQMVDVELTKEEWDKVYSEYLKKKEEHRSGTDYAYDDTQRNRVGSSSV